jgi:CRP/FNR family transcriptional regulator, cyclic AMP receptor protein
VRMALPDCCKQLPEVHVEPGDVLLTEGVTSGKLYVLIEGELQILCGDVEVATADHAGAVFGEMALLLGCAHTATVKALAPSRLYVVDDAEGFVAASPDMMRHIGGLLALRLQLATGYLADIKAQYAEHDSHLCLLDTVLGTLLHQQEPGFAPGGSDRGSDPSR